MDLGLNLKVKCHINKNGDGDRFVGIKADTNQAMVYFPMGYRLPDSEDDIRDDILKLISVLAEFTDSKDKVLAMQKFEAPQSVNFPINAYMNIIRYYLEQRSYYTEKDVIRKTSDRGKIDFAASLRRNVSFFQEDGTPFFDKYTVKGSTPNEKNLITMIHKYCVHESFVQMGWLFMPDIPPNPHIERNIPLFLSVLKKKLAVTHLEKDILLFEAMISMLEYLDEQSDDKQFYFGTDRFEYVWEKLIDAVFGIKEKEEYFPRTTWHLKYSDTHRNYALEPDTIMLCNGKIYVLDAKYYRYGVTKIPSHLPESTSINKQITYGEYIYNHKKFKKKYGDDVPVFNAFLMPYNKKDNLFEIDEYFAQIGEADSDWKYGHHNYEHVQGIVVDIRFLMNNYYGSHKSKIIKMAKLIEEALQENAEPLPEEKVE
ncbi:MAG: LlaJI family restriction endonuclease [Lachnospiraceae bacterium]